MRPLTGLPADNVGDPAQLADELVEPRVRDRVGEERRVADGDVTAVPRHERRGAQVRHGRPLLGGQLAGASGRPRETVGREGGV